MLDKSCFIEMDGVIWQKARRSGPNGNSKVFGTERDEQGRVLIANSNMQDLPAACLTPYQVGLYLAEYRQVDPADIDAQREVDRRHLGPVLADSYTVAEFVAFADGVHKDEFDKYAQELAPATA